MTNTLTNIMPKILARGLKVLRQSVIMPRLVNNDYSSEAARKGDVINVPIGRDRTSSAVVPGPTPPAPTDSAFDNVQITLDQWEHSDFGMTDKDLVQIDKDQHFVPIQMEGALKALANTVNVQIWSQYKSIYGFVGTAGTTPFATDASAAINVRKVLHQQLCPRTGRNGVLDYDAEANALALAPFRDASQSDDPDVITEGEMGRKYGIDWFTDDHVPTHTAGTGSGYLVNDSGGMAIGETLVTVDTGTGTILVGDIVTFAGHTQTYAVTAALAANQFSIYPPLVASVADDAAITLKATHKVNVVFNREAWAFATRPLLPSVQDVLAGRKFMSMQDPKSGLTLRLELIPQYKQVMWDFDILWGSKMVRPQFAARIAG